MNVESAAISIVSHPLVSDQFAVAPAATAAGPADEAAPEDRIRECLRQGFVPYSAEGVAATGRVVAKAREELDQEAFDRWIEDYEPGLRVDLLAAERVSNADVKPRDHIIGRFLRERDAVAFELDPEACEDLDGITSEAVA
ncbi:hypothetical protein [Singulisphaera sp. PoT]|uniref:hypothetical protein n=1 Tax=Singulisphaera sp. PoT TaxID=3411797 RepID=UPI003BF5A904